MTKANIKRAAEAAYMQDTLLFAECCGLAVVRDLIDTGGEKTLRKPTEFSKQALRHLNALRNDRLLRMRDRLR